MTNRRPLEILMVEDNASDVRLAQEAFKEGRIPNNLHVVRDGVEAMAFLRRQSKYANAARPDLIFLDLNLPRKDGREVLAEIKSDSDLIRIPVVVLTTSRAQMDIFQSYDLHANCYIVKPIDLDEFIKVIQSIGNFWFSTATLPTLT
jgi:CheY-like chemotaxis protein